MVNDSSTGADTLKAKGAPATLERDYRAALEKNLDEPGQLERLGLLLLQHGRSAEARTILMRAHELSPDSPGIRIHAARACVACRDQRADELLRSWRDCMPLADDLQLDLADLLAQTSEPWDAMEVLEDLVQRVPMEWSAQLLLARIYERVNQPDRAEARLHWIAAAAPADGDAGIRREIEMQQAQLAMRKREYAGARALLEKAGPGYAENHGHYFALARACDKLGDSAAAIRALEKAHGIQIEELRASNPHLLEAEVPLPRANDRANEDDYRAWPALKAPDTGQSPVFVVGFPRSGTTLLEQMLDAHPRLQSMDERPFLNMLASQLEDIGVVLPDDIHKFNQRDCDELRKGYVVMACGKVPRRWDARLVDKNPLNMLWLPVIHRIFPRAKFILALRHPCDVILSCYLQNFRAAPLVAACRSLESLARAYVAAMENWLHHAALFQPDVFISRYEDLVADAHAQTRRIATFLGLDDAASMLQFDAIAREKGYIRTPSYTQVIEPINSRGVGHWQQYREHFREVLPILQPMLDHWGYGTGPGPRP